MSELWEGFTRALELIISLDPDVVEISWRSLRLAMASTFIACLICIPLGSLIHFYRFPGKNGVISIIQTFFAFPTVVVGLFVFVLLRSSGPFGSLDFVFTPTAIVVGQAILISPIMLGFVLAALRGVPASIPDTALGLGASDRQAMVVVLREAKYAVMAAIVMGFGRAISEVGVSMIVGGNIKGFTRTLTTAIALESSKGELELCMALGVILLALAFGVNLVVYTAQRR